MRFPDKLDVLTVHARLISETGGTAYCRQSNISLLSGYGNTMATAKEHISEIIRRQPDNSTYDDIVRELAFDLMVQRGLKDSDARRTIPNEGMERRIKTWQRF